MTTAGLQPMVLEEILFAGKIPLENLSIQMNVDKTVSVLATRTGAQRAENPERTADEIIDRPIKRIAVDDHIYQFAIEALKSALFKPEYLRNLNTFSYSNEDPHGGSVKMETNLTNYGSLVAVRKLAGKLCPEYFYNLENQIAPMGVIINTVSPKYGCIFFGKRGKTDVGGTWMPYPAGSMSENDSIVGCIEKELDEEASLTFDYAWGYEPTLRPIKETNIYFNGLVRGSPQSCNPAFVFTREADVSPKEMWKGTDKINKLIGSREHDSVIAVPWEEAALENYMLDHLFSVKPKTGEIFYKQVDSGILSVMQSARSYGFSEKWNNRMVSALRDYNINVVSGNPFTPK